MNRLGFWITAGGLVIGLLGGFMIGLWSVFLSPWYAGTVPLPLAPIFAAVGNIALIWFTKRVTARTGLALLPGVVWFGVMLVALGKTTEGDLLITGDDYMGLIALLVGSLAWAVAAYRMILPKVNGPGVGRATTGKLPAAGTPQAASKSPTGRRPRR